MKDNTMSLDRRTGTSFSLTKVSTKVFAAVAIALSLSISANAEPVAQSRNTRSQQAQVPAIVYLPDVQLQQLAPQEVAVAANRPVTDAVGKILQAYKGQDVGITGYNVSIDPNTHAATINFIVKDPRGAEVFESLSSANQYALFESIRQTLLSQSLFNIEEITFTANGVPFDI
ncbi:hypothetical protein [Aerosakkonema funiforme]|uniref:TonB-dependent receptor n=1 Tax=Aerosakkonema funiforme FACHB-1375 TaxID=2949571 RepID=A0A926VHB5_9CYAN|nr:hypothetical protein [Aerosakkonema funiforme]MBD2183733.1 hypothetical protein [Aerosakkonema funiforme FACHB-1375]